MQPGSTSRLWKNTGPVPFTAGRSGSTTPSRNFFLKLQVPLAPNAYKKFTQARAATVFFMMVQRLSNTALSYRYCITECSAVKKWLKVKQERP
jgi:hypothetical protein